MREDKQRQAGVASEEPAGSLQSFDDTGSQTTFSGSGPIPPVASGMPGTAPVSASDRAYGSQTYLGFDGLDGSLNKPRIPTTHTPLTKEHDLAALTARKDAEALLLGKRIDVTADATKALQLMIDVPDGDRGKVIDSLDGQAFENLLDRISSEQRERFSELVRVSHNPERKLRLWAEAHKSRALNDVERNKGDIGGPIATYQDEDADGNVTTEIDDEEEKEIRKKLTKDQVRNRKRHLRRQAAATTTQGEVDAEVKALMAKAKKGQLSLQDVDDMRERKELEYKIELESNVNLTEDSSPRQSGEAVHWNKSELEQVERTLARLPQAQDPDGFDELRRVKSKSIFDGTGGEYTQNRIEITDWGASPSAGFRHGGDKREMVSDDYKQKYGDKLTPLEFVLTHESGHDAAKKHDKAFDAFQKTAGWERVKVDALRADGLTDDKIATLEARRSNPNAKLSDIEGRTKIYSPIEESKDEFWAVPKTSIPAVDEADPGPRGEDTWAYARVNPSEHFAEVYAKAVQVPEKLYDDLIVKPTEAATKARGFYERMKRQADSLQADKHAPHRELKLANLNAMLGDLKSDMLKLEAVRDQRAEEFAIMRNSVFGTDKAVKLAVKRLHEKKVSGDKIHEFEQRAAHASTPEQVAYLEHEASK